MGNEAREGGGVRGRWRHRFSAGLGLVFLFAATGCAGRHSAPAAQPPRTERARPTTGEDPGVRVYHRMEPGETLWRIARAYGVRWEEIARANGIDDPTDVPSGTLLLIPGARATKDVPSGRMAPKPDRDAPGFIWPVPGGEILSYFGEPRRTHRHAGIDIRGRHGQEIYAAESGRVIYSAGTSGAYGKLVILEHAGGYQTLYAHNSDLLVKKGHRVERGEPIARVGRTGNATTDHCHFEIRRDRRPVDPLPYLSSVARE